MKRIPLTQGKYAIVDNEDYEYLNQWKWCAATDRCGQWYALRGINRKGKVEIIRMHRLIMDLVKYNTKQVDHINHDGLDNRRSNLRICTSALNARNARPYKNGNSKYKGVHWCKKYKRWVAVIYLNRKQTYIGSFVNELEAANAYDRKAKELHGEYACFNFPEQKKESA